MISLIRDNILFNSFSVDQPEAADEDEIKPIESLQFNFNTIRLATDNFSTANKLGQGGFGSVYKLNNFSVMLNTVSKCVDIYDVIHLKLFLGRTTSKVIL